MTSETMHFFSVQIALLAVVLVLHTYIGLHIVRRTLIFSDLVLDQLAALGALAGISLGTAYGCARSYLFSTAAVLCGAVLLALIAPKRRSVPREAVIGIMYALALAASLLLGDKLTGGQAYVSKTLSGSMLWVSWPLVGVTAAVYSALLWFHWAFRRQFIALAEDASGVRNAKLWDFLLFATQGIITVLIVPIAGVLLAYAFLMIPAAAGSMSRRSWSGALIIGWTTGFAACLIGLCLSYRLDLPYGPSLVVCLGVLFTVVLALRRTFAHWRGC